MRSQRNGKRTCTLGSKPKKRFPTELDAKLALARISRSNDDQYRVNVPVRAYRHPACGGWHLTHIPAREYASA